MRAWKVLTPRSSPAASFAAAVEQGSHDRLDLGPEGDDCRDERDEQKEEDYGDGTQARLSGVS